MQRYFITDEQFNNGNIVITNSDVHHMRDVMRMAEGDNVVCTTLSGKSYTCEIAFLDKNKASLKVIEALNEFNELNGKITIAQGLVRREKTEEVLRRITELGAYAYIRVRMIRSIVKANDEKLERFNMIVKEASEQSHRSRLLEVYPIMDLKQLISLREQNDYCYFADANEKSIDIYSLPCDFKGKNVLILVGPEGGYDDREVKLLQDSGFIPLSFGKRVLRTETAPLYACSIFSYLMGEQNEN